jgi:CHAD domain-containing protein
MLINHKIKKRLSKINVFLNSDKKPGAKTIHRLRLEIKHLESIFELMTSQHSFGARPELPKGLEKLFRNAGKLRKFGLEKEAIQSITRKSGIVRPTRILQELDIYKRKNVRKLRKRRMTFHTLETGSLAKHPEVNLSVEKWQRFVAEQARAIQNLLESDIVANVHSLHELRKKLKTLIYVLPLGENGAEAVQLFLNRHKKLMKSVESKIGEIHDIDFFIRWLEKRMDNKDVREQYALDKILEEWKYDIKNKKGELNPLLTETRKFALDLSKQSGNLDKIL